MNLTKYINQLLRLIEDGSPRDYLIIASCTVLVGFVCLKGFGSRDKY
ncbi:hypothetical protein ACFL2H_09965 [Planctomycetota bacterium]